MARDNNDLDLLLRYETSFSRMHDRALRAFQRLREEPGLQNDPNLPPAKTENPPESKLQNHPNRSESIPDTIQEKTLNPTQPIRYPGGITQ